MQDPVPIARTALNLLLAGKYTELRAMFNSQMLSAVSEDTLRQKVGPQFEALGKPASFGSPLVQKVQNVSAVIFPGKFPAGNFNIVVSVDNAGKVAGLFLRPGQGTAQGPALALPRPAWKPPAYSIPANFRERNVTVVSGSFNLPGVLTVPVTACRHPAVVLVQGSGPSDRDESAFAYKPFRDLAEGLASRGIVVLRYDKRTFAYQPPPSLQGFTAEAETVDDALSALGLLRNQPEVDANRVFLLGHSFGGYLAPRIAQKDGRLAGIVIMSGNSRPLEDVLLEQNQYAGANAQQLQDIEHQVASVKAVEPGDTNSYFGLPASYWLDLKGYDPVAQARALRCRLLVLQGGRDFQLSLEDYNRWKSGLASDRNATVLFYPALNHFLVPGTGNGSIAEYQKPGNVDLAIINEISNWVKT